MTDHIKQSRFRPVIRVLRRLMIALVILFVVSQIIMTGIVILFNTPQGHDIIQKQISTLATKHGYAVTLGDLFYDPLRGLNIYDTTVADARGPLISFDRVSIGLSPLKLLARDLDVYISGDTLTIPARAKADVVDEKKPLAPFDVPYMYVRTIHPHISFDKIILEKSDDAPPVEFSPRLSGWISVRDGIAGDLTLTPGLTGVAMPETVTTAFHFAPDTLDLNLKDLSVKSNDYLASLSGTGNLSGAGALNFKLTGVHDDLTKVTADKLQRAEFDGTVTGTRDKPIVALNGKITPASLADAGLGDIIFSVTPDLSADISTAALTVQTVFKQQPIILASHITYAAPTLTVQTLDMTAPGAKVIGTATVNTTTRLADGALHIDVADFAAYHDLLSVDISGSLLGDITLSAPENVQSIGLNATAKNIVYNKIRVDSVNATTTIENIQNRWPRESTITVNGLALPGNLNLKKMTATLKKTGDDLFGITLDGAGRMQKPFTFKGSTTISDLKGTFPSAHDIKLNVTMRKSALVLNGNVTPDAVNMMLKTNNFRLNDLPVDLPGKLGPARANGTITMTGTPSAPITNADITLSRAKDDKFGGFNVKLTGNAAENIAKMTLTAQGNGMGTLSATGQIPFTLSLYPFKYEMDPDVPVTGSLRANMDIAPITNLFLGVTQELVGRINASGTIAGTLNSPDINGKLSLSKGGFKDTLNGIDFADIAANTTFNQNRVNISSLTATDAEDGHLQGSGNIGLSGGGTNMALTMTNFHIPKQDMADGYINATLKLSDTSGGYNVGGQIDVQKMNVAIPERFQSKVPELNIVQKSTAANANDPAKSIALNINVNAPNQVFVRGWGLDAEFGGTIGVGGTAAAPDMNGTLASIRGRYEEFGKRFELAHANLRFQGAVPPFPYLDIEATTTAEDVTASILLTGPFNKPTIAFSSTPALAQDEVLSRILFGKTATNISAFQAIELAQTLRRFSGQGGGGFDPLGTLRTATGLDDISVETDEAGQTSVGVGKYLTDKVYLEYEQGQAENSGAAQLQIQVSPKVNVDTEVGQDARVGGGITWKHDY